MTRSEILRPANLDAIDDHEELSEVSEALTLLAEYAKYKGWAVRRRKEGQVGMALRYEKHCDELFKQLPSWMRW